MGWFCPEDFEPSEKTIEFCKKKGLSEDQIEDQLDSMRDWEFQKKRTNWDACFRTWIRNGLQWGRITVVRGSIKPQELTQEQRQADILAFERDPLIRKALGAKR